MVCVLMVCVLMVCVLMVCVLMVCVLCTDKGTVFVSGMLISVDFGSKKSEKLISRKKLENDIYEGCPNTTILVCVWCVVCGVCVCPPMMLDLTPHKCTFRYFRVLARQNCPTCATKVLPSKRSCSRSLLPSNDASLNPL